MNAYCYLSLCTEMRTINHFHTKLHKQTQELGVGILFNKHLQQQKALKIMHVVQTATVIANFKSNIYTIQRDPYANKSN